MSDTWRSMSAADLGRGIEAGRICPVTLTAAFLDAIDSHPHRDRIYARVMRQRALDAAAAARGRAQAGLRRGPLDGVPVSWKDLFDTAGVATEAGSALLKGRVPTRNAQVVRRLADAGLPPLGKTHMTELAFSGLGLNPVTATPPCIHDPDRVPGGSSSGSAASVAWGLAPLSIGSDTGGSVRVPSVWNDLVGLKTTAGRIPLSGVVPLAEKFDTIGPLARTVEDAALAFALLDSTPAPDLTGASLKGTRMLVLETVALADLDPAAAQGFEQALAALARAGARIDRAPVPAVAEAMDLAGVLFTAECYGIWGDTIEANPDVMFAPVRDRFRAGAQYPAHDYVRAWRRLEVLRAAYGAATAGYDAVLIPTAPTLPERIDRLLADPAYFAAFNLKTLRNTRIGNLMGLCALTLPTGVPMTGVMMMARPRDEARLLRLGAAAERALKA
ncbi:MAG: amidase [Rhodobacter sp.]|uniref:amidase n=1 Tax=Pararhodobacter sp. TaxID=2127056 RepID=UPI001DF635C8|nr:amidase family protein [Pararhodobacter sp.]MCB1345138.1 amidase [Paracoccaceae bacterium]MCC0072814.1 amidase [Rhodobacter sp.]HPD90921.1 amidase family protein [Pararhodobacter sp.]